MNSRKRKKRIEKEAREILQLLEKAGIDPKIFVDKHLKKALEELKEEKKDDRY